MFFTPLHARVYTRLRVRTQRVLLFHLHPSPRPRRALLVNCFEVKVFPKNEVHRGSRPIVPICERCEARGAKVKGEDAKSSPFTSCNTTRYTGWVKEGRQKTKSGGRARMRARAKSFTCDEALRSERRFRKARSPATSTRCAAHTCPAHGLAALPGAFTHRTPASSAADGKTMTRKASRMRRNQRPAPPCASLTHSSVWRPSCNRRPGQSPS